ncbi:MAG: UbiA family prenyltransferase [bacterium]|nr:UbiA family prenyltransferase [bacterium]
MRGFIFRLMWNHADAWGLAGMIAAAAVTLHHAWSWQAGALVAAVMGATWIGFAFNDYCDAPIDAADPRKQSRNPFIGIMPSRRVIVTVGIGIALAAPVLAYAVFAWRGIAVLVAGGLAAWAYSAPPLRLKSRPLFDLMAHAAFVQTFPYTITLILLDLPFTPLDRALLALFILASLGAQLEQQARDYAAERDIERNFTTRYGQRTTAVLLRTITGLLGLAALIFTLSGVFPAHLLPFAAIMLPVALHRFTRRADQPRDERLIRAALFAALAYCGWWIVSG